MFLACAPRPASVSSPPAELFSHPSPSVGFSFGTASTLPGSREAESRVHTTHAHPAAGRRGGEARRGEAGRAGEDRRQARTPPLRRSTRDVVGGAGLRPAPSGES
jgi:hypothetical protein